MKKITRKDLKGLLDFPVITRENLRKVVGGVTQEQFDSWAGLWPGGYVDGMGYVLAEAVVYGYPGTTWGYNSFGYTGNEWWQYQWNLMHGYGSNSSYNYPGNGSDSSTASNSLSVLFDRSDGRIYIYLKADC